MGRRSESFEGQSLGRSSTWNVGDGRESDSEQSAQSDYNPARVAREERRKRDSLRVDTAKVFAERVDAKYRPLRDQEVDAADRQTKAASRFYDDRINPLERRANVMDSSNTDYENVEAALDASVDTYTKVTSRSKQRRIKAELDYQEKTGPARKAVVEAKDASSKTRTEMVQQQQRDQEWDQILQQARGRRQGREGSGS